MKFETKFNIGDKALTLGRGEVITVFIIGIEIRVNGHQQDRDSECKTIPIGTVITSYTVSKTQLATILEKRCQHDYWNLPESSLFATKAELAASLGLT